MTDVLLIYNSCSAYLEKWTKSFTEFESFDWMLLSKNSIAQFYFSIISHNANVDRIFS